MKEQQQFSLTVLIAAIVIAGGAGFYGGTKYAGAGTPEQMVGGFPQGPGGVPSEDIRQRFQGGTGAPGGAGGQGFRGGSGFAQPVVGKIVATTENGFSVALEDGSSKVVIIGDSTTVMRSEAASSDALIAGESVMVMGSANDDGTYTARSVQIGQVMRPNSGSERPTLSDQE